jgi:riboflavin synthase
MSIGTSLASQISEGDSVAVNGVCLTATRVGPRSFDVDLMNQTLALTALNDMVPFGRLNLELAMKAEDRFGGHIVQGHVDGVGTVISATDEGIARRLRVELSRDLLRYVVPQGSITLNGVSLSVADLGDSWAEVSLIPETLERTNLGEAQPGSKLNVECDIVAKYVERLVAPFAGKEQA